MKKYKIGMFVGTILLGLSLVGCKKKTNKDNTTTEDTTTVTPVEKVIVEFDSNGGSNVTSQNIEKGTYATKPKDPTLEGYTFDGWYYEESKWIFDTFAVSKNVKLTAKWTINNYDISLSKNIDAAGTVTGEGNYEYNSEVTLTATTNEGYDFEGWYVGENNVCEEEDYTFNMPASDTLYEARWTPKKYSIGIINQTDNEEVVVTFTPEPPSYGNNFDYGSTVTLTASNVRDGYFVEWYIIGVDGTNQVGSTYKVTMPAENIYICVKYADPYKRVDNKIYFGYYPQSEEKDSDIKASLNELVGTPKESKEGYNWIDYGYYIAEKVQSYMWYIDLDTDNDGRFDYRGVYLDQYRPYNLTEYSSAETSQQDESGYNLNEVYWFKYEIIEWNVLKEEDGKAMLSARFVLDSQEIYYLNSTNKINHNGGYGYANNYALSSIRKWLNDNFYNTAFLACEKAIIQDTTVDNSETTVRVTPNSFVCDSTLDKVFLLSYQEVMNLYQNDAGRNTYGTDYARSQGLGMFKNVGDHVYWWMRSPDHGDANDMCRVSYWGTTNQCFGTYFSNTGVLPALWIEL